jgi:hypothetical protein
MDGWVVVCRPPPSYFFDLVIGIRHKCYDIDR